MLPGNLVALIAAELNLGLAVVEELIEVVQTGQEGPASIRHLAHAHAWTYNETAFLLDRVRRRLVEHGYLDDPRVAQQIRDGPPLTFMHASGQVGTVVVEGEGETHEQLRVGVIVGRVPGFREWRLSFTYPKGAPKYEEVREALLAGGPSGSGARRPQIHSGPARRPASGNWSGRVR